jgi:hypothetical protein
LITPPSTRLSCHDVIEFGAEVCRAFWSLAMKGDLPITVWYGNDIRGFYIDMMAMPPPWRP